MFMRYLKGQSAIEYLMTYGWMLLVVSVVGGAIFATVNQQGVESTSGFTGEDVMVVDQFGANSYDELEMVLRNGGAEKIEMNEVRVSDGENTAVWKPQREKRELEVGGSQVATFLQVEEGGETSSLDVELNYDMGGLENLESRGSITGNFQIIEASEFYDMDPFVLHVNSTRPGSTNDTQFEIGTGGGNFNYQVQWESLEDSSEGEIIDPLTGAHTLNFDSPGMHRVEIRGLYPEPLFYPEDPKKIETLEAWGDIEIVGNPRSMFQDAVNMEANYTDTPDTSRATGLHRAFLNAEDFNGDLSGWDTSNVEDLGRTFWQASDFEGEGLETWDVSNVRKMQKTFEGASSFNGDISDWETNSLTNMRKTFPGASSFNRDISSWNVSQVDDMKWLFLGASSFDQDISSWCVEKIEQEPGAFDNNAGFEGEDSKQPDWGEPCS